MFPTERSVFPLIPHAEGEIILLKYLSTPFELREKFGLIYSYFEDNVFYLDQSQPI